jgi:hypothetical protein
MSARRASLAFALVAAIALVAMFVARGGEHANPQATQSATAAVSYWTTPGLEPDSCLAAWLLTRFVSPGACVDIAAESTTGSIAFDVPGAALQRRPGACTSRVILETYRITDPFAVAAVDVIQELELMPWSDNADPFFIRMRWGLADAVNAEGTDTERLAAAMAFLDALRQELADEGAVSGVGASSN